MGFTDLEKAYDRVNRKAFLSGRYPECMMGGINCLSGIMSMLIV